MNVGSLFSGIGGLDLGLERAGMQVRWQCEIDPYCRAVLKHHWPRVKCYEDIRDIHSWAERVDLIAGGFPCQPVSLAGKGLAQEDPRWLWPEFARVVGLLRPRYVLVENVPGLIRRGLMDVISDLAEMGYDAEWELVSAAACGAPHLRERLFVVAYASSEGRQQDTKGSRSDEATNGRRPKEDHLAPSDGEGDLDGSVPGDVAYAYSTPRDSSWTPSEKVFRPEAFQRLGRRGSSSYWVDRPLEPGVRLVAHGVPDRLARLAAGGNAVVPAVAEAVGRMILESCAPDGRDKRRVDSTVTHGRTEVEIAPVDSHQSGEAA